MWQNMTTHGNVPKNGSLTNNFNYCIITYMAEIYTFIPKEKPKVDTTKLDSLRAKLLELYEARDCINKEIRYTKDAITLLEKGEQ